MKQLSRPKSKQITGRLLLRRMWCNNFDHLLRECDEFIKALRNDIVIFKEERIHSRKSRRVLQINFGKDSINVLVDGVRKIHAIKIRIYRVEVDCTSVSIHVPNQRSS